MRLTLLLILSLFFWNASGQLHHQMLSSQGSTSTTQNGGLVTQTIGQQSMIGNYTSRGLHIGQGFQQANWPVTPNNLPTGTPAAFNYTQDDPDIEVDLTSGITDPDGDSLSIIDLTIEYLTGDVNGNNYQAVTDQDILDQFKLIVETASLEGNKLQLNLTSSKFLSGLQSGKIRISYKVTDGRGQINVSNEISITGKNDPPAAADKVETQTPVLNQDGEKQKDVNGNDILKTIEEGVKVVSAVEGTDPDTGDSITYELSQASTESKGTLEFNEDGSYSFTPEEHFYGDVEFEYFVEDSFGEKKGPFKVTIKIAESPDDDGIPSKLETRGKSDDLDGDGIPDRKQNNISHFPMSSYQDFVSAKSWAEGTGGTIPPQSKYGAILVGSISDAEGQFGENNYRSDPNAKLKDLGIVAKPNEIEQTFEFKADLYQFSIVPEPNTTLTDLDDTRDGLQTRIVIDLPSGIEATTYIKKAADGSFFSFKDDQNLATFDDGATLIDTNQDGLVDRIVITLTDNAIGDTDPELGQFSDPGGLGTALPQIEEHTTSSFVEGISEDTFIYDVNESSTNNDSDLEGDELTYSLTDSNAEKVKNALKIDSSTGIISVKESEYFDFEAFVDNQGVAVIEAVVQVSDPNGNTDQVTITIPITNVDEYPRIISGTAIEFLEGQSTDVVVVDIETLPDFQDITTYSILDGKDGADMNINSSTGELKFNATPLYLQKSEYIIDIQASDNSGKTDIAEFVISILQENIDSDGDSIIDDLDNCPLISNPDQLDTDADGVGDVCDNATNIPNPDQRDTDGDGLGDVIDPDDDNDGCLDDNDTFPLDPSECSDNDVDGIGDNADPDDDNDSILDIEDNCVFSPNINQLDTDGDGIGDVCDIDIDNDGFSDQDEITCGSDPLDVSSKPLDTDADGIVDCIDTDDDGDGYLDENDVFPLDKDEWIDNDEDGIGNNADTDDDNDGQSDEEEVFCGTNPLDSNSFSGDIDNDGITDCRDLDNDNDGVNDPSDAFPLDPAEWTDTDEDGIGNNADTDDDNDGFLDLDELECNSDPLDNLDLPDDLDQDGIPDCKDTDIDGDGCINTEDVFPTDPSECEDTDGDGLGNNVDVDDDNDGVIDSDDAFPLDQSETKDADGDGIGDNADPDDNNDGFNDEELIVSGVLTPNSDGLESTWKIINLNMYPYARVSVYNKNGQEVFAAQDYKNDWKGTFMNNSNPLPAASYYYVIELNTGEKPITGWLYITY